MAANQPPTDTRYAAFAGRLLAGMKRTGVTQMAIAKELGVDKETVRLWMRGERMARDAKLRRLAKMIDVDVSVLRYGPEAGRGAVTLSHMKGEHVTDEDELRLLEAYRGLKKDWAKEALRRRAVELLQEFGERGARNPWAETGAGGAGTQ